MVSHVQSLWSGNIGKIRRASCRGSYDSQMLRSKTGDAGKASLRYLVLKEVSNVLVEEHESSLTTAWLAVSPVPTLLSLTSPSCSISVFAPAWVDRPVLDILGLCARWIDCLKMMSTDYCRRLNCACDKYVMKYTKAALCRCAQGYDRHRHSLSQLSTHSHNTGLHCSSHDSEVGGSKTGSAQILGYLGLH